MSEKGESGRGCFCSGTEQGAQPELKEAARLVISHTGRVQIRHSLYFGLPLFNHCLATEALLAHSSFPFSALPTWDAVSLSPLTSMAR